MRTCQQVKGKNQQSEGRTKGTIRGRIGETTKEEWIWGITKGRRKTIIGRWGIGQGSKDTWKRRRRGRGRIAT